MEGAEYTLAYTECNDLESIAWWNWDDLKISQDLDVFYDIEGFVKKWS